MWVSAVNADDPLEANAPLHLTYRLFNQGDADAYAVIVETNTALGSLHPPRRLEPGPLAGQALKRTEHISLVPGMREVCVEVKLQTLTAGAPQDENSANNRICRSLKPGQRSS